MNTIKQIFSNLSIGKYISRDDKTKLEKLRSELDNTQHQKLCKELEELINKNKLSKKAYETITKLLEALINEETTTQDTNILLEEAIKFIDDDLLENKLDKACERYMKFNTNNPAEYISKRENYYRLSLPNKKEIVSNNIKVIIEKLKKNYPKKEKNFQNLWDQKKIEYKNKKIIIYMSNNKAYFDINHIINLFDNTNIKDKYHEYKNDIIFYDFRDNEFGGFYIKEFISQEIFYKMLLHSNNTFSNKFKDDIAKILDELTNNDQLIIHNGNLELVNNKDVFENINYCYTQTYNNNELVDFIKSRIIEFKKVNWNKYSKRNVIYFFVTTLQDPNGLNRILCKVGFSSDIVERIKSLKHEYKSKFYLIGLKLVNRSQDEKEFHTLLKIQFPELAVKLKIDNHDKDEIYVFDIYLYNIFISYVETAKFNQEELLVDEESKKKMDEYFNNIEERFEIEILYKLHNNIKINEIVNEYQQNIAIKINDVLYQKLIINKELRELEIKEKYEFKKFAVVKEQEIKLKDYELKLKELDVRLKEMEHKESMKEIEKLRLTLELEKLKKV
jgi:hypothetical protein